MFLQLAGNERHFRCLSTKTKIACALVRGYCRSSGQARQQARLAGHRQAKEEGREKAAQVPKEAESALRRQIGLLRKTHGARLAASSLLGLTFDHLDSQVCIIISIRQEWSRIDGSFCMCIINATVVEVAGMSGHVADTWPQTESFY